MTDTPFGNQAIAPIFVSALAKSELDAQTWLTDVLRVESALAQAQSEHGIIPTEAAEAIAALTADLFDIEALGERSETVGFPIVGVVEQIAALLPDAMGEYAHWGATTQDILDSAQALKLVRSFDRLESELIAIGRRLSELADEGRSMLMLGRSQGQPAVPTTFGLRVAGWLSGLTRHLDRLRESRPRVLALQLSGAVGTAAAFGPDAGAVQARCAELLGLNLVDVNWHTQRDGFVEAAALATSISGSLGKIGIDVAMSSQPGVAELLEGDRGEGSGASSTMPQKRNPVLSQQLVQNARLTRNLLPIVIEAMVSDHDRGTGVWPTEWVAIPHLMALSVSAAGKARMLLEHLEVDATAMRENLDAIDGAMAEAVMMALASEHGRQQAHDLVMEAIRSHPDKTLSDALGTEGVMVDRSVFDPSTYLGTTQAQIDAAIANFAERL